MPTLRRMILVSSPAATELPLAPPTGTPMHALFLPTRGQKLTGALSVVFVLLFAPVRVIAGGPSSISFDRDIGPLLTSRCAKCHGPGEGKAGLHLTDREAATIVLPSGELAIVPGKPDESELLRR